MSVPFPSKLRLHKGSLFLSTQMLACEHDVRGACSLVVSTPIAHGVFNSTPRSAWYCTACHFRLVDVPKRIVLSV